MKDFNESDVVDLLLLFNNVWEDHRKRGFSPRGWVHYSFLKDKKVVLNVLLERSLIHEVKNDRLKGYAIRPLGREQAQLWISDQLSRSS